MPRPSNPAIGRPFDSNTVLLLAGLTMAGVLVHGYHPFTEDAEVYLPSMLRILDPALYPHDPAFALAHARWTLFPYLVAGSIRVSHITVEFALLAWHLATVMGLLWACRRIARRCFPETHAAWCGVALVAGLLTIPVAGTALYIMDPYVTSRSLATPAALLMLACVLEGKRWRTLGWLAFAAAAHPLTGAFAGSLWAVLLLNRSTGAPSIAAAAFPMGAAYGEALRGRPYLFLTRWAWYGWLGALAPLAILAWFGRLARRSEFGPMEALCRALIVWQTAFLILGLAVSLPESPAGWARVQPMRTLQLLYILMLLFIGGLVGRFVLKRRWWAWALLFLPLGGGMFYAQRELFPATPHLEWPGLTSPNAWVGAFEWIRGNTPKDAFFALDPEHMRRIGEDQHGFRALARRSRLADAVKDAGPVSLMPELAARWKEQVDAQRGLDRFTREDFLSLREAHGANWTVVQRAAPPGLTCPYHDGDLHVCRIQ